MKYIYISSECIFEAALKY